MCNCCGNCLKIGNGSTSTLDRHTKTHPEIYDKLFELQRGIKERPLPPFKNSKTSSPSNDNPKKRKQQTNIGFQKIEKKKMLSKKDAEAKSLRAQAMYAEHLNWPFSDFDNNHFRQMTEAAVEASRAGRIVR